jgi:AraC-like DNA-binding protein
LNRERLGPAAIMSGAALTVAASVLHPFGAVLLDEGVALGPLLRQARISRKDYDAPDARITGTSLGVFLRAAERATHHPALDLAAAKRYDLARFQLLEYMAASSSNVIEGLFALVRSQELFSDTRHFQLEPHGHDLLLRFTRSASDTPHCLVDFVVGAISLGTIRAFKSWSRRANGGGWAWFEYPEPAGAAAHREFFRDRVRFGAQANGILIPQALLHLSLARPNPQVQDVLEPKVRAQIRGARSARSLTDQVRTFLTDALVEGELGLSAAASRLHMSPSTLKRRLADEGVTYRDVLSGLRKNLALQHLGQPELSVGEVAHRLGYEDVTAFHKAFKRWTDETPSEYRARTMPSKRNAGR